jgi:hypothetical protein
MVSIRAWYYSYNEYHRIPCEHDLRSKSQETNALSLHVCVLAVNHFLTQSEPGLGMNVIPTQVQRSKKEFQVRP